MCKPKLWKRKLYKTQLFQMWQVFGVTCGRQRCVTSWKLLNLENAFITLSASHKSVVTLYRYLSQDTYIHTNYHDKWTVYCCWTSNESRRFCWGGGRSPLILRFIDMCMKSEEKASHFELNLMLVTSSVGLEAAEIIKISPLLVPFL